jgi:hypothetical protein
MRRIIQAEVERDTALAAKLKRASNKKLQELVDAASGSPQALIDLLSQWHKRPSLRLDRAIAQLRNKGADATLLRFVFKEAPNVLTEKDITALRALSYFETASFDSWRELSGLSHRDLEATIDRLNRRSLLDIVEGEERYALDQLSREYAIC